MHSNKPSNLSVCLSGCDAVTLLEIIHTSLSCSSNDELSALFPRIRELFPFEFAVVALGRLCSDSEIEMVKGINVSFPDEWMREYTSRNYFQVDEIIKENFTTYRVQYWSLARKKLSRRKEITSLGMDFGIKECLTHGISPVSTESYGSMFCFAGMSMKYDGCTQAILEHIIPHLHLSISNIFNSSKSADANVKLSQREKEVLNWLKQGKSSWDMSMIMGVSERTINFHLYNVMRKLGSINRPQTVAVATRLGLIDLM